MTGVDAFFIQSACQHEVKPMFRFFSSHFDNGIPTQKKIKSNNHLVSKEGINKQYLIKRGHKQGYGFSFQGF